MNKKVLTLIGLIALVAILATGAFAYFNSATTSTGHISSGTLALKVAGGDSEPCSGFGDSTTVWSMANMAPGDTFGGYLCMKNTGTIDAKQVTFDWVYAPELEPLANRIFVTWIQDSTDPGNMIEYFDCYDDEICTLAELAYWSNSHGFPYDGWTTEEPFLPSGGSVVRWLKLEFQFDPAAGNEFQGLNFDYDLIVTAEQEPVQ